MQEHPAYAETLTHYLASLTIVGMVLVVLGFITVAYLSYTKKINVYAMSASKYIFPVGFFVSFIGLFLTIFYSEVLRYAACDLCWYQRVFLYPQVFLFGYAWLKKDRAILPYTVLLSFVGLGIATYHHLLQIGFDIMKPCSTAPFAVDCSKPSFIEFGFVTFPFMAVVLFAFLGLISYVAQKATK